MNNQIPASHIVANQFQQFTRMNSQSPISQQNKVPMPFQPQTHNQTTKQEYLNAKNIPQPIPAKKPNTDIEPSHHRMLTMPDIQQQPKQAKGMKNQEILMAELDREKFQKLQLQEQFIAMADQMEKYSQENQDLKNHIVMMERQYEKMKNSSESKELRIKLQEEQEECLYYKNLYEQNEQNRSQRRIELENKVVMLAQELERLNQALEHKQKQAHQMEVSFNRKIEETEQTVKYSYQNQLSQMNEQYKTEIFSLEEQLRICQQRNIEKKNQSENNSSRIIQENKLVMLATEVDRLKLMTEQKQKEIDSLHSMRQLNELKNESTSKQLFQIQVSQVTDQYKSEILTLEDQLRIQKQRISDMKCQIDQNMNEVNKSNTRYAEAVRDRDSYLAEIYKMRQDLEIVSMQLDEKSQDVDGLNEKILMMESRHTCELNEAKSNFEYTKRSVCDGQLRELTVKFNQDRQNFEHTLRSINQKLIETENKVVLVSQENERINFRYNERAQEIETNKSRLSSADVEKQAIFYELQDWRSSYQTLERSFQFKIQELQLNLEQSKQQLEQQTQISKLDLTGTKDKHLDSLTQLLLVNIEMSRLLDQQEKQEHQIKQQAQDLRDHLRKAQKQDEKITLLNNQLDQNNFDNQQYIIGKQTILGDLLLCKIEIERLVQTNNDTNHQFSNLMEDQKIQYKLEMGRKCDLLRDELESEIQQQMEMNQQEIQSQQEQIVQLSSENYRLNNDLENLKQNNKLSISQSQDKYDQIVFKSKDLQEKYMQTLTKVLLQNLEMERLIQQLQEYVNYSQQLEDEGVQRDLHYNEKYDQMQLQYENRMEKQKNDLNAEYSNHLNQLQRQNIQNEERFELITQEVERLNSALKHKQDEIARVQNEKQKSIQEIQELYSQIDQYTSEINMMQQVSIDSRDLEIKFEAERTSWDTQNQTYVSALQDWEQRYQYLSQDNMKLIRNVEDKYKELEEYRNRSNDQEIFDELQEYQHKYNQLKEDYYDIEQAKVRMNSQMNNLETQLNHMRMNVESKEREVQELYNLLAKQRKDNDHCNKDNENHKNSHYQLQQVLQQLQNQLMTTQEIASNFQKEREELSQHVSYLEKQNESLRESMLIKNREVTDRIKELDMIKEKFNSQMMMSNTTTSHRISYSRQSISNKQNEQNENNSFDMSLSRMKSSSSVPPQQQIRSTRQAMSIITNNFNKEPVM